MSIFTPYQATHTPTDDFLQLLRKSLAQELEIFVDKEVGKFVDELELKVRDKAKEITVKVVNGASVMLQNSSIDTDNIDLTFRFRRKP